MVDYQTATTDIADDLKQADKQPYSASYGGYCECCSSLHLFNQGSGLGREYFERRGHWPLSDKLPGERLSRISEQGNRQSAAGFD